MSDRTIIIEHEGTTYYGQLGRIKSTSLGFKDHGVLSAWLQVEWSGGGAGVGGYCLDEPRSKDAKDYARTGTAYGLDHVIRLIETVGVDQWEALCGQHVIVLFDRASSLGRMSLGIAGVDNGKVLILADHAKTWLEQVPS